MVQGAFRVGQVKMDEDFWFEDGNVILVNQGVGFRVHRGVLCKMSSFFQNLFSVPQPDNQDQLDGCPLVHMHESANDVHHLLDIVYNGRR